ncbi:hypothetical protein [Mucilaginibacter sp. AK015]|uniref:hypothetical protein n=1 Tax=Mucilaginibacter sp. AK015 TaxID=2723072 RepID=UPI00160A0240|nr:hypothetical protein [Mucilaginibacter sp. AK015]MBB5394889.1 hypothetical protein [Mucilaginibacter sp. AK015]
MEKRPAAGVGMGVGSIGAAALSVGASFSYNKKSYYYGKTPDNVVKLDKKHFIEVMSAMMADKPETVERIKSKKLRLGDMDDLLYFYKYGIMPPAQAPDPFSGSNN